MDICQWFINIVVKSRKFKKVDDVVEVTLEFEGNDANNEWFLMDVVFEEKVL